MCGIINGIMMGSLTGGNSEIAAAALRHPTSRILICRQGKRWPRVFGAQLPVQLGSGCWSSGPDRSCESFVSRLAAGVRMGTRGHAHAHRRSPEHGIQREPLAAVTDTKRVSPARRGRSRGRRYLAARLAGSLQGQSPTESGIGRMLHRSLFIKPAPWRRCLPPWAYAVQDLITASR